MPAKRILYCNGRICNIPSSQLNSATIYPPKFFTFSADKQNSLEQIKFELEELGSVANFNTIGNFDFIADKYRYQSVEVLKDSLRKYFLSKGYENFDEWINDLDEFN